MTECIAPAGMLMNDTPDDCNAMPLQIDHRLGC